MNDEELKAIIDSIQQRWSYDGSLALVVQALREMDARQRNLIRGLEEVKQLFRRRSTDG